MTQHTLPQAPKVSSVCCCAVPSASARRPSAGPVVGYSCVHLPGDHGIRLWPERQGWQVHQVLHALLDAALHLTNRAQLPSGPAAGATRCGWTSQRCADALRRTTCCIRALELLILLRATNLGRLGCVQCMAETDNPNKCIEQREDYFECLHHRKEVRSSLAQAVAHVHVLDNKALRFVRNTTSMAQY